VVEKAGRTLNAALATILLAGALIPAVAHAGRYDVYSCRTPSGEVAPTDGWSAVPPAATAMGSESIDTCPEHGALTAALVGGSTHSPSDLAAWEFSAPVGETIAGATVWRAGDTAGGSSTTFSYEYWLAGPENSDPFTECISALHCDGQGTMEVPLASANRVVVPAASLGGHLYLDATCIVGLVSGTKCPAGGKDGSGYAAAVYLYAADITLEQAAGPSVTSVSGELATETAVKGRSDVSFTASDPGSGLWQAVVSIDGHVTQTTPLDEEGGRCKPFDISEDGLPAFLYLEPCPASLSAEVGVDTTGLQNGMHQFTVQVEDAAGNLATVVNRTIDVENPTCGGTASGPEGTLQASWEESHGQAVTSAWGARQKVLGRLTGAGGTPIPRAPITLAWTPVSSTASTAELAAPQTSANGSFTAKVLATGLSRTLCLVYRPLSGGTPLVASLELHMRAGVALHVHPHTTSIGHTIHFTGSLLGGPVPPGGKAIVLEARSPGGRWIEFDVIHTGPRGRFTAGYTFKFEGPARYQFRAVSEEEADYPYATGASDVVGVFER
jgi:hypothetical protein